MGGINRTDPQGRKEIRNKQIASTSRTVPSSVPHTRAVCRFLQTRTVSGEEEVPCRLLLIKAPKSP